MYIAAPPTIAPPAAALGLNVKPESADFVDDVEAAGGCEDTVPPPPPPPPRENAGFGAEAEEGDGTAGAAGPATKSQQEYTAQPADARKSPIFC